jgi:cytochrome c-type biogenesis protein
MGDLQDFRGEYMYEFFSKISAMLSDPFTTIVFSTEIALISALFLGFIGSVAPCQISANVGAITYFGNRQFQQRLSWVEVTMYILGKIFVFSLFGAVFWLFGENLSKEMIPLFAYSRKFLGPLIILIGIFLIGWIRLPGNIGFRFSNGLRKVSERVGGNSGAFLMGAAFSLGFCPTMFWLFFGMLMPIVMQSSYGILLPPVFAVGTAMPFLLIAGLTVGLGLDRIMVKKTKIIGSWIQKAAGIFLIVLGILDTLTYWTL